jgi:hypothetical protein
MKLSKQKADRDILAKRSSSIIPAAMTVPIPTRPSLFGSSSLTEIPPAASTPPSSPPPRSPVDLPISIHTSPDRAIEALEDEETFPVKKPGPSKRGPRRRVQASSDEEEDRIASSSKITPRPSHIPVPTFTSPPKSWHHKKTSHKSPAPRSRTTTPATESEAGGTPRQSHLAKALFSTPGEDSDSDAELQKPLSPRESGDVNVEAPQEPKETDEEFLAKMFASPEGKKGSQRVDPIEDIDDPAGPYGSNDDEVPVARSKKLKVSHSSSTWNLANE